MVHTENNYILDNCFVSIFPLTIFKSFNNIVYKNKGQNPKRKCTDYEISKANIL